MPMRSRNALPSIPVASLIDRNDTTAQADENNRRITAYIEHLETHRLPLPADPQQPLRLSIIEAARESGVHLRSLRPGARSRRILDEYQRRAGVAIIVKKVAASPTIEEFVQRLPCSQRERPNMRERR